MQNKLIQYFVEGECEKKLIDSFKVEPYNRFISGKVSVFNFIQKTITWNRLMMLTPNTTIVLVYDIDVQDTHILEKNIMTLKKYGFKEIYHIQSIKNFEDELLYSSKLKNINDLFNTEGVKEFKSAFLQHKDICSKLEVVDFSTEKIWSRENKKPPFDKYSNQESLDFIRSHNLVYSN